MSLKYHIIHFIVKDMEKQLEIDQKKVKLHFSKKFHLLFGCSKVVPLLTVFFKEVTWVMWVKDVSMKVSMVFP